MLIRARTAHALPLDTATHFQTHALHVQVEQCSKTWRKDTLKAVGDIIWRSRRTIKDGTYEFVHNARVPVVTFVHGPSGEHLLSHTVAIMSFGNPPNKLSKVLLALTQVLTNFKVCEASCQQLEFAKHWRCYSTSSFLQIEVTVSHQPVGLWSLSQVRWSCPGRKLLTCSWAWGTGACRPGQMTACLVPRASLGINQVLCLLCFGQ
jgi:hypothetical protein